MDGSVTVNEEFQRLNSIIIFGASVKGEIAYAALKEQKQIVAFCDSDVKKHGSVFCGVNVISPEELAKYKDCGVLIASMYYGEIACRITKLGIKNCFVFWCDLNEVLYSEIKYAVRKLPDVSLYENFNIASDNRRQANISDFTNFLQGKPDKADFSISTGEINYYEGKQRNILFIAYIFPPIGGSGVQRSSKFVKYLKKEGYNPIIVSARKTNYLDYLPSDETLLNDIDPDVSIIRIDDLHCGNTDITGDERFEACDVIDGIMNDSVLMNGFLESMRNYNNKTLRLNMFFSPWPAKVLKVLHEILNFSRIGLVYSTSFPYFDHFVGFYLKSKYNLPWAVDFRDEWTNNTRRVKPVDCEIERSLEKSVVIKSDALISVSEIATENFSRICGIPKEKTFCITNGYDEDDFKLAGAPTGCCKNSGKFTIRYGGVIYQGYTPVSEFLDAVNCLIEEGAIEKDKLLIEFNGEYTSQLKGCIKKNDKYDVVTILPHLEHIDNIRMMQEADVLLFLPGAGISNYTGKIFEYIRMGVPILSIGALGSLPDKLICKTETGVTCNQYDLKSIKKELLKMYDSFFMGGIEYNPNYKEIENYKRKALTGKLISVFEKMTGAQAF